MERLERKRNEEIRGENAEGEMTGEKDGRESPANVGEALPEPGQRRMKTR